MLPFVAWIHTFPSSLFSHVVSPPSPHAEPYLYYGQRYYPMMQGQRSTAMLSPYFNQSSFPFVPSAPKPGPLLSPVGEVGYRRGLKSRRRSRRRRSRARRSRWVV